MLIVSSNLKNNETWNFSRFKQHQSTRIITFYTFEMSSQFTFVLKYVGGIFCLFWLVHSSYLRKGRHDVLSIAFHPVSPASWLLPSPRHLCPREVTTAVADVAPFQDVCPLPLTLSCLTVF